MNPFCRNLILIIVSFTSFSSCTQEQKFKLGKWLGLTPEEKSNLPKPLSSSIASSLQSGAANQNKISTENAELLHELFVDVFGREPQDHFEFGNWADVLNQGASLEGVYNGLTHSSRYRQLEAENQGSSAEALRVFGEELAYLESELSPQTQFDEKSAAPLAVLGVQNLTDSENPTQVIEFPSRSATSNPSTNFGGPSPTPVAVNIPALSDQYSKLFVGASIFTLKRVLGEEAIKVIATENSYQQKLATWYSKWVVRIAGRNVDFGLPLRNKPDEALHYKWVLDHPVDRVTWEVLNRLLRVLNEANKAK